MFEKKIYANMFGTQIVFGVRSLRYSEPAYTVRHLQVLCHRY